jgi:hypothetical protein
MIFLLFLLLAVLGPLAFFYGVDSRDTHTDLTLR